MPCAICLCNYIDPRILPCGHSFCEECLKNIIVNYKIVCPACREKHRNIEINLFPKNYGLVDEVETVKKAQELYESEKIAEQKHSKKRNRKNSTKKEKTGVKTSQPEKINQEFIAKSIKLTEPKVRMSWFKLESYSRQVVFSFVFIFLCLV